MGAFPASDERSSTPSAHPKSHRAPHQDGTCFKKWVSPFAASQQTMTPHIATCTPIEAGPDSDCGTAVTCPPEAEPLLAELRAKQDNAGEK